MSAYDHYFFKDSLHGEYNVFFCHYENIKTSNWIFRAVPNSKTFEIQLNINLRSSPSQRECNKMVKQFLDDQLKAKKNQ